jgi:rare lipoprotein A
MVREHARGLGTTAGVLSFSLMSALFSSCVRPSHEHSSFTITRSRHAGGESRESTIEVEPIAEEVPETGDAPDDREPIEVLEGRASYYADRFEGRSTASGEPYRARELTAASRDLPFGTLVRVVRVDTGASVIVRVNDRGPFRDHSRILDLSRAAAEALDMIRSGVIDIRAEVLERGGE